MARIKQERAHSYLENFAELRRYLDMYEGEQ